jgi:toxin ParE1/3/4
MIIRIHPDAEHEFNRSVDFYSDESVRVAERFIQEVEAALDQVSLSPNRWPEFEEGTRIKFLKRFPFSIVYGAMRDEVHILAIMHQSREPNYWKGRQIG